MPGLERGNCELNGALIRDTTSLNDPMDRHGFRTHPGDVGGGAVHFFTPLHIAYVSNTRAGFWGSSIQGWRDVG